MSKYMIVFSLVLLTCSAFSCGKSEKESGASPSTSVTIRHTKEQMEVISSLPEDLSFGLVELVAGQEEMGVLVEIDVPDDNEPIGPIDEESRDYSIFLKLSGTKGVRMPTPEELKELDAIWPKAPLNQNAAFYFALAASQVLREGEPLGSVSREEWYEGNKKALEDWVAANNKALETMKKGLSLRVCRLPVFIQTGKDPRTGAIREGNVATPLGVFSGFRHLALTCSDAAFVEELNGRHEEAAEIYLSCIKMGSLVRKDGPPIQNLVGIALCGMALAGLDRLMVSQHLPDGRLRRIIAECAAAEAQRDEAVRAWDNEVAMQNWGYARIGPGKEWEEFWTASEAELKPGYTLHVPDRSAFLKALPEAQKTVRGILARPLADLVSTDPGADALFDDAAKDAGPAEPYFRLFTPFLAPWASTTADLNIQLRATQLRAAILLYQRRHGKVPARLDDLCPDFLAAVPQDPFAKAPFRYVRTARCWKVWSVWRDHKDNGGHNFTPGNPWSGDEAVFWSILASNEQRRSGFRGAIDENGSFRLLRPGEVLPGEFHGRPAKPVE